jgi:general secretion pathway protein D
MAATVAIWNPSSGVAQTWGQMQSQAKALVTGVTATDVSASETRLLLVFNQQAPPFSIITNNSTTAIIAFPGASLAPSAAAPTGRHGAVQAINLAQNDNMLTLTLSGPQPLRVIATQLSRGVALTIVGAADKPVHEDPAPGASATHVDLEPGFVFEVVPLRYADVSEIVGLLTSGQAVKSNDGFNPQEPAFGSAGMSGAYGGGGIPSPNLGGGAGYSPGNGDALGQSVDDTVGIDRRLNAIILRGPAARVALLKEQIAKLDVAVTSVVLETVFVELTETGARNVGLDFNNGNSQVATVSYAFSQGGFPTVGDTSRNGAVSVNLQAAVYAQIQHGQGRIISKPRIAAQSGSTAKIVTGDALPILTAIALSGVNAVSQQVQYVNVGVTLQIAPRVTDDGIVTSHIFAEVSTVTGRSQGYPTISQREATTSATVRDGESFVIGGLTQDSDLSTHGKIPLAGDLPVVGSLFRLENTSKAKTQLYIIVTPHIVKGRDVEAASLAAQ